MFEKASRMQLRFSSPIGALTVEDLWKIPLRAWPGHPCLDDIAKELRAALRTDLNDSLVDTPSSPKEDLQLKFDLVKHIITVRLAEETAWKDAAATAQRKQRLLGLIAQKQDEQLSQLSVEELQKQVEAL
jgi:hypothetical protein